MLASLVLFIVVYFFIATEKVDKTVIVLLGGCVAILSGMLTFEQAMAAIDLNVIFLLIGMMTAVGILGETGFFEWVALYIAKRSKGNIILIFVLLLAVTMVFSALLDNVTTIILLAPVTILIAQILELNPIPLLIMESLASNIGGTATLIGDPPNIIIGSKAGLTFNDFIIHLSPVVVVIAIVFIVSSVILLRKSLHVSEQIKERVIHSYPELAITDGRKLKIVIAVFGIIFCGFFLHHMLHVPPGIVALGGMSLLLLVCKSKTEKTLKVIEWDVILFFIGLFILIGALEANGVLEHVAHFILTVCGDNMILTCMIVLVGSAFFSAVLDNIPFVIAMTPLIQKLLESSHLPTHGVHPLFWSLALGACLGGNGTLIGASANVVAAKIGEKNGYRITFWNFSKYGCPFMIQSLLISALYIYIRYF